MFKYFNINFIYNLLLISYLIFFKKLNNYNTKYLFFFLLARWGLLDFM